MTLKGKTLLVSGGIRGFGKNIIQKLSEQEANIVIIGKSVHPHPDMPDTIYSAAELAENNGATALPIQVDIRFDDQIQKAINQAVDTFGRIDAVINAAAVIQRGDSTRTSMPSYDLINQINVRGAFMLCKFASDYLKDSNNSQIINVCPPVSCFDSKTTQEALVYTLSKLELSYITLALSSEYQESGIGVNGIWPKFPIHGDESMYLGDFAASQPYSPDVLADAIVQLLHKNSQEFTGQLLLDAPFLEEHSKNFDLSSYSLENQVPG